MRAGHLLITATLVALSGRTLAAQQARQIEPTLGLSVGTMSIDSDAAAASQVGDRSWGLQFDFNLLVKRHFVFAVDLGGQFLDDKASFTQNTTGGEKKSTANVTYLSAMTGLRTGMLAAVPVQLGVNVGGSVTMSRRSIDNCVDCQVDKLSIPGGAFVEPTVLFGRRQVRGRVTDRMYFGGSGMQNVISAGIEVSLQKKK